MVNRKPLLAWPGCVFLCIGCISFSGSAAQFGGEVNVSIPSGGLNFSETPTPSNELEHPTTSPVPTPVQAPSSEINYGATRNVSNSSPLPSVPPSNDVVPPASAPVVAVASTSSASLYPTSLVPVVPLGSPSWPPSAAATAPLHESPKGGGNVPAIAAGVAMSLLVIFAIAVLAWFYKRRKRKRTKAGRPGAATQRPQARGKTKGSLSSTGTEFLCPSHAGPRSFSYAELSIATSNFSESELLGRGGFGSVYKGKLQDEDGTLVAVKRIEESSSQGDKEFRAEVNIISDLRHRNLVRLIGWCYDKSTFLLVYEYMPNGSLDHLLFDDTLCAKLSWERRHSIAMGLGSALQYLHEECDKVIIHRDIKSSNVLLDERFNAKLGDFGLARQLIQGISAHTTTVAGTHGYMAPECLIGLRRATRETDMYAFGAVLLELVCGKRALDPKRLEAYDGILVEWVWRLHGHDRLMEAVDERLRGMYDKEEARRVLVVGLACSFPDPKARPKIRQALDALMGSAALPLVPLYRPPIIIFGSSSSPPAASSQIVRGDSATTNSTDSSTTHSSSSTDLFGRPSLLTMP